MYSFFSASDFFSISVNAVSGFYSMPDKHYHDKYEIYYLTQGERYYFIKDKTFKIKKGNLIFINKGVIHKTADTDKQDHKRILINFKKEYINNSDSSIDKILDMLTVEEYLVINLSLKDQQYMEMIFNEMIEETEKQIQGFEIVIRGILMKLLVTIVRSMESINELEFISNEPKHEKASEIVKYINSHYNEPITIPFLSKRFFISPYYLSRIFKTTTGFTVVEYINNIRVMKAQKILLKPGIKVIQLLEETGFGSVANFNRVFKAVTGFSPVNYRKSQINI